MKKQLRFVLFAVLVLVMVMTMAFMASATEAPAPADTDNYQVVNATGGHVGYYATLDAALEGITADNYKIVVLKNVTETAGVALDKSFTYTITGGTGGKTITFTGTVKSSRSTSSAPAYAYFDLTAGKVTLQDLTIVAGSEIANPANEYFMLGGSAATGLTLDSFKTSGTVDTAFCYGNRTCEIVLKGTTEINVNAPRLFHFFHTNSKNSTLTVSGGAYTVNGNFAESRVTVTVSVENATVDCGSGNFVAFTHANAKGTAVTLKNGADVKAAANVILGEKAMDPVTVTIEAGAKVAGKTIFNFATSSSKKTPLNVNLNGGEFHVVGLEGALANDATIFKTFALGTNVAPANTKVYFDDGAKVPGTAFDEFFDWSKIAVLFSGYDGYYEIDAAGEYNFTGFDCALYQTMKAQAERGASVDATRFPHVTVDVTGWIQIVVNHEDAVLNISGAYTVNGNTYLVKVVKGTVNMSASVTSTSTTQPIFIAEGGTLNVLDGVFKGNVFASFKGAGALNIANGTFTACKNIFTADAEYNVAIAGGTFAGGTVLNLTGKGAVTISGGTFTGNLTSSLFVLNHAEAALTIAGGTFADAGVTVDAKLGSFTMTGGYITVPKDKIGVNIDGAVSVVIAPAAGSTEVPVIELVVATYSDSLVKGAIVLTANAASAVADTPVLSIGGGKFGNVYNSNVDSYMYAIYNKGTAPISISGGEFYGANSATAIEMCCGELNISGGEFYGYRNIRLLSAASVLNISGGNFHNRVNQPNNILIEVQAANSTVNISGGSFNDFMYALRVSVASTINITGGVFNHRSANAAATDAMVYLYSNANAVNLTLGKIVEGVSEGPVINLTNKAQAISIAADKKANIVVNGATFNIVNPENVFLNLGNAASVDSLAINGGSFHVLGSGARLIPAELDVSGAKVTVTGGSVTMGEGTILPLYEYFDTSALKVYVTGVIDGSQQLIIINKPNTVAGVDGNGDPITTIVPYVFNSVSDQIAILKAYFAEITLAEGVEENMTSWMRMILNHEDAELQFNNVSISVTKSFLIRVIAGKLTVNGGNLSASGSGTLFDICGDAAFTLNGGNYSVQDMDARFVSVADGVNTENMEIININLTVGILGQSPLEIQMNKTMDQLVVNGLSGIKFEEAGTFTITGLADIKDMVEIPLRNAGFANNLTVDLTSWVPLVINNPDVVVNIVGGEYSCTGAYMFQLVAGTLNITGGTFNALGGNFINLTGAGVVNFAPATDSEINVNVLGAVIYANKAANSKVTVSGGRYVETTPDITANQMDTLFTYDQSACAGAELVIDNGYFEATRMILLYYSSSSATINGGTFVSNFVVTADGPVTSRSTTNNNEHMLSPRGTNAVLTINGGSFDNKDGRYIIAANGSAEGAVTTITGGTFEGGSGWYFTNGKTTFSAKDATFTDTRKSALNAYFDISGLGAVATFENLTCTGGVSTSNIFWASKGAVTIKSGTYTGSMFYATTNATVTVEGGTFNVTGEKATALYVGDTALNATHFNIVNPINMTVSDHAFIIKGQIGKAAAKAIFAKVTMTTVGNVRFDCYEVRGELVIDDNMTAIKNVIKDYIPNITFTDLPMLDGDGNQMYDENDNPLYIKSIYGMLFYGTGTKVLVNLSDDIVWTFAGDTLYYLNNGASMTIVSGKFNITGGDFIYISNGNGTKLVFGSPDDATKCPEVYVGKGGNVLQNASVASDTTIYNGRFVKEVIDTANYTSPLFYYSSASASAKSTLTIYNGFFKATRILMDYYGKVNTTIWGGKFESNFTLDNVTEANYAKAYFNDLAAATPENPFVFNPQKHLNTTDAYIMNVRGQDSYLNIYGGEFDGKYGYAIFWSNGGDYATFNFYGGYFTGGFFWFYTNRIVTLNFDSYVNELGETVMPVFEAKDSYTDHGFQIVRSGDIATENPNGGNPQITVRAGKFTMKDLYGRNMWNFMGTTDMKIYGGTFTITVDKTIAMKGRTPQTVIFRTDSNGATDMDIYGGTFVGVRIIYYRYAGGTLNIYDGTFRSNWEGKSTGNGLPDTSYMINIAHDDAIFNIYGGTFRGNEYTYAIFTMNVATGNKMQLNIYGGTITGGGKWLYANKPGTINIDKNPLADNEPYEGFKATNPTFKELSVKGTDSTVYAFYIANTCVGGTMNIKYFKATLDATTTATALFVTEGGSFNFDPVNKNDIQIDVTCRLFQITNAFRGAVTIKNGNYISREVANMFYITTTAASVTDPTVLMDSTFTIEGGDFKSYDNSTMFCIYCEVAEYTIRIKGGNFESENARTFMLSGYDDSLIGMATTFIVDGGKFTTKSARMIYLDHNAAPLIINGGTFLFEDRNGNKTDDAIIYAAGKQSSTVLVKGGTFIDNRTDNEQTIINMNFRANIRFEGDFKFYTLDKKPYFLKDVNTPANSIPLSNTTEIYKDVEYYVSYGYYTEYAPTMVGMPVLRPVLGAEGLTFTSSVSAENAAYLATLGTVSYGTLIFPTEFMAEGWRNGTDFLEELRAYASENGRAEKDVFLMVEAKDGLVTDDDGNLTIRASLINIKSKNYTRNFTGVAYAKVTDENGNETYYWATHMCSGVTNTMRTVAENAINDTNSAPVAKNGRVYCYVSIMKNNTYSRYPSVFQESLRKYLPANVKPKS